MSCDEFRETVLEIATEEADRRRFSKALAHVDSCEQCQAALADFDQIAAVLKNDQNVPLPDFTRKFDIGDISDIGRYLKVDTAPPPQTEPIAARRRIFRIDPIIGLAAALLIGVGAFWVGQRSIGQGSIGHGSMSSRTALADRGSSPAVTVGGEGSARNFSIGSSELVHDAISFARVSRAVDNQAGWILASNSSDPSGISSSEEIGLLTDPMDTHRRVDVLRLTLLRETEVVSSVDLVIVTGQTADLTIKLSAGNSVHYRARISANGATRLNLLAEIHGSGDDQPVASLSTTLEMQPNGQVSAGELQTPSGRYELYGSISRTKLPGHLQNE
jgi:hypothetical protein